MMVLGKSKRWVMDEQYMSDAVMIPGGGVTADGQLPAWTLRRLEAALNSEPARYYICLSAGTFHKPLPTDHEGFPIYESVVAAQYLREAGIAEERLLFETSSYDTLGNAYFARTIHTEPLELTRLKVITSNFHMPRTQAIFEFMFSDRFSALPYQLAFESVSDAGLDEAVIAERRQREAESLVRFQARSNDVHHAGHLHQWLFSEHDAYNLKGQREQLSQTLLASY